MQIQFINKQNTFGNLTAASKKIIKQEVAELKQLNEDDRAHACLSNMKRLDKKSSNLYRVTYNGDYILLKSRCKKLADGELSKGFFIDTPLEKLLQQAINFIDAQISSAKSPKRNIFAQLLKKIKL